MLRQTIAMEKLTTVLEAKAGSLAEQPVPVLPLFSPDDSAATGPPTVTPRIQLKLCRVAVSSAIALPLTGAPPTATVAVNPERDVQ